MLDIVMAQLFSCDDCGKPTPNSRDITSVDGSCVLRTVHRCDACQDRFDQELDFQCEGETIQEPDMICPWCGHVYEPEHSWAYIDVGAEEEVECECCGKKFDVEVENHPRFSTKRSLCEMPEDYGKEER